jgi:hypothetical protein
MASTRDRVISNQVKINSERLMRDKKVSSPQLGRARGTVCRVRDLCRGGEKEKSRKVLTAH